MSTMAEQRGVPFIAPREMRGEQGNPEITVYCPKCDDRVVPLRSGACGWCDTNLTPSIQPDRLETQASETSAKLVSTAEPPPVPVVTAETTDVARWRRDAIVEWLRDNGPATQVEIAQRFDISKGVLQCDVASLRREGHIERTGEARCRVGRGGRPSPEFCAVEIADPDSRIVNHDLDPPPTPDYLLGAAGDHVEKNGKPKTIAETIAERRDAGLTIDPTPYPDRPGASARTQAIGAEVRRELEARYAEGDGEEPDRLSVHQQLTVRYVTALIGWIERSSIVRDQGPPEHVYARIERLLGIQDGVA